MKKANLKISLLSKEVVDLFVDHIVGVGTFKREDMESEMATVMISSGGSVLVPFTQEEVVAAVKEAAEKGSSSLVAKEE